jgi:hypothetical protein
MTTYTQQLRESIYIKQMQHTAVSWIGSDNDCVNHLSGRCSTQQYHGLDRITEATELIHKEMQQTTVLWIGEAVDSSSRL